MDRSRTEGENVSTLRWWTVANDGCSSFKEIDGQVENGRRKCFYFAMMICFCWWIPVLQGHFGTGRERKEKLFVLCDDDLLPLMDLRPSRKLMDRWRTEVETDSTFGWWSVSVIRCHCQYAIQQSDHICLFTYANCLLNTCVFCLKIYDLFFDLFKLISSTAGVSHYLCLFTCANRLFINTLVHITTFIQRICTKNTHLNPSNNFLKN